VAVRAAAITAAVETTLAVLADMHAGRVEPQVHEQLVIQPAIPEDGDVVVDGLADP
jgi:hypothetical protein